MRRIAPWVLLIATASSAAWAQSGTTPSPSSFAGKRIAAIINRLTPTQQNAMTAPAASANNGIQYNGGPILDDANGVNVYFIWYGDWSNNKDAQMILVNFITHIGGSPYFNINTTYYSLSTAANGSTTIRDRVINSVHYMGSANDNYSQGASLSDDQVYLAVANAITSGALPADANGVYFLLTSPDVNETSGFGTVYCAWHMSAASAQVAPVDGVDIKFAFVGDAETQYAYQCIYDYQTPLSSNLGADGMASMIAHELEESVTDPDGTSWWSNLGGIQYGENADLCAWYFGPVFHSGSASDPQPPDMKFDGIPYLIQWNWVNANGGYCELRWDD